MADCVWCKKKLGFWEGNSMAFGTLCKECYELRDQARKGDYDALTALKGYVSTADIGMAKEALLQTLEKGLEEQDKIEFQQEQERQEEENQRLREERAQRCQNILLNTGYNYEGYNIVEYCGIVSAEAVLGTGIFSELSLSINDFFGTTSNSYQSKFALAKETATNNLKMVAVDKGANAIIGIDFDILTLTNNAIVVSANGTAVKIEKIQ